MTKMSNKIQAFSPKFLSLAFHSNPTSRTYTRRAVVAVLKILKMFWEINLRKNKSWDKDDPWRKKKTSLSQWGVNSHGTVAWITKCYYWMCHPEHVWVEQANSSRWVKELTSCDWSQKIPISGPPAFTFRSSRGKKLQSFTYMTILDHIRVKMKMWAAMGQRNKALILQKRGNFGTNKKCNQIHPKLSHWGTVKKFERWR